MPYSEEHKQQSRQKILKSALTLFTRKGYDNVTINEVMNDAELTHGAFYGHFKSKSELYSEAVLSVTINKPVSEQANQNESNEKVLKSLISNYLSLSHVNQENRACPLAFLATDIATRDHDVRDAYTQAYKAFVGLVSHKLPAESSETNHETSLAFVALLVGGVAVSRALNDDAIVERILSACRNSAEQMVGRDK